MASESSHLTLVRYLPQCLKRVGSHISTWIGAGSTALGAVADATGNKVVAPSMLWWIIAICAVFYTALLIEAELMEERATRNPVPDMPAIDAIRRIVGGEIRPDDQESTDAVSRAAFTFQQAAHLGRIAVWGREPEFPEVPEFVHTEVLTPIEASFWRKTGVDFVTMFGGDVRTERASGDRRYFDLHVSRAQVDAVWPAPRRGWRLRLPFEARTA